MERFILFTRIIVRSALPRLRAAVYAALRTLNGSQNVYATGSGQTASKLQQLNLTPRVAVHTNGTWYPVLRTDNSTDYLFILSRDSDSRGHLTTGKRRPLLHYQRRGNTTEIPLHVAANQTVAFAFSNELWSEIETPYLHALRVPSNVLDYNYSTSCGLLLHTSTDHCNDCNFQLSNGTSYYLSLDSTSLTSNLQRNTTHHLDTLVFWLDIPGLKNASGLGYYSSFFSWPPSSAYNVDGAYLTFPNIAQGIKVTVNGHDVEPLDFTNPRVDIGPYITSDSNEVTAMISTLMWNHIRSIYDEIEISEIAPLLSDLLPDRMGNGLIGEVKIIPYVTTQYMI
ncbi:hypothetical protein BO83DRAFT_395915 [Aspergillus eucalypticola CBS 122712]|uniref:Uncharacterized protein n=1 Tax=Aspergillus eucalypticola (strain CBS 122712 / IBT 29274) TaxID=1448314 RepID=A0A317W4S2_ASPEC|nr:uncharacterized protein BO83DRAFT_395915 [Aspergillus eucalypticola CBS 122712]PWY81019.1 hypothetical protein BO83DRAFT_395915 [Aspergillus eucalypticola CBS 122712]